MNETQSATTLRDEPLRFVRSFGDLFITFGVLVLGMVANYHADTQLKAGVWLLALFALAEFLVARKRLVLPGMVILLMMIFLSDALMAVAGEDRGALDWLVASVVAAVFFIRYRLPFAMVASLVCFVIATFVSLVEIGVSNWVYSSVLVVFGLATFALAMTFDARDRNRQTMQSDTGFWLHLAAAPMLTHGVMVGYIIETQSFGGALPVLFYLVFCSVALIVDRRALVISGVIYMIATVAINAFESQLLSVANSLMALGLLGVGSILLGVYWYGLRRRLFGWLNGTFIAQWVPPFETSDMP